MSDLVNSVVKRSVIVDDDDDQNVECDSKLCREESRHPESTDHVSLLAVDHLSMVAPHEIHAHKLPVHSVKDDEGEYGQVCNSEIECDVNFRMDSKVEADIEFSKVERCHSRNDEDVIANRKDGNFSVHSCRRWIRSVGCFFNRIVPHGGFISNTYNLAAVTIGSGIIALPAAFNQTGVVIAVLVLLWITICTVYSVYLLAVVVEKTGLRCYESMAHKLLGRGWDYFAAFLMWLFCFGSCVSYVISIGDLLTPALQPKDADGNIIRIESLPPYLQTKAGNRCLTSLVWICIMLPLSLPKEINSLRYASVIGVTCMMYFVICIIVHSARDFDHGHSKYDMAAFQTGNQVIVGVSLFLFAYMCQSNFFEVYREMHNPTPIRITIQTAASMTVCTILYLLSGVFGYADFGSAIKDSILLYYDVRQDIMVAVSYFGIGFKMCVGFAICMQPSRDAVYYCINWDVQTVPWWKNSLVCGFMAVVALILGMFIPNVTIVFSLTGSLCGGFLGFIFPVLYIMYAGKWGLKQVGWFHYIACFLLMISGVISVVFGTVASIYAEAVR